MDRNTLSPFYGNLVSWDGKVACCLGVKQLCLFFVRVFVSFRRGEDKRMVKQEM